MYELECDKLLKYIYDNGRVNRENGTLDLPGIDSNQREAIFAILLNEQFLYHVSIGYCDITDKGKAFLHTDNFVDRRKRWDLEKKSNLLEYSLKKYSLYIAIMGLVISVISLFVSLG